MNNIHNYLQNLETVGPSKPMVLINGKLQLIDTSSSLATKAANWFKKPEQNATKVLQELNQFLRQHLQELDSRDFPALSSIYNYFEGLRMDDGAQAEKSWLQNLCRSLEALKNPLAVDAQPPLASCVPDHMKTTYRFRIAEQTKLISADLHDLDKPMKEGTIIEGGETEDSLAELIAKAQQRSMPESRETKISVINRDCLDVAADYKDEPGVTLLNMANANGPGGGWLIGDCAQEEELFRRTNYHRALMPEENAVLNQQLTGGRYRIPFFGAIFTPSVTVLRNRENQLLPPDQRFQINMIASAAIDLRFYSGNEEFKMCNGDKEKIAQFTKQKIRAQLATALLHDTEIVILGAFGCGAFGHDPLLVAACYKEVFEEPLFKQAFREIVFSIIDPYYNTKNYTAFANQFA